MTRLPKFIFPIFFLGFFVIAPLIIAHASGYRFNFKTWSINRVGIIIIDGKPKQTTTKFNGNIVGDKLPLKIKSVQPDLYNIELSHEDYHSLNLRRELKPGESLVISPLFLLQKNAPSLIRAENIRYIASNSDNSNIYISVLKNSAQSIMRFNGQNFSELVFDSHENYINATLNIDETALLIEKNNGYSVISLLENSIQNIDACSALWSTNNPEIIYAITKNHELVSYNKNTNKQTTILKNTSCPLVVFDDEIVFVRALKDTKQLTSLYLADLSNPKFIEEWKQNNNDKTIYAPKYINPLLIHDNNIIRFSYALKPEVLMPYDNYSFAWQTKDDGKTIMYAYNSFEIIKWNVGDNFTSSIARYSGGIRAIEPLIGTDYLIVSLNNQLLAINTFASESNTITLLDNVEINKIQSSKNGGSLYLFGKINDTQGMFELNVRDR